MSWLYLLKFDEIVRRYLLFLAGIDKLGIR